MEDWLIAFLAGLAGLILVALVVLLLLRRPAAGGDPAVAERLGALGAGLAVLRAELSAETARHAAETAQKHQALAIDQTRVLNDVLGATREAMLDRFAAQERAHLAFGAEHRDGAARAQAALLEALNRGTAALGALLEGSRGAVAEHFGSQREAHLALGAELREGAARGQAAMLEALGAETAKLHALLERKAHEAREEMGARLDAMRQANDARLAEIQRSVSEQLAGAVEKQMNESFQRVIDQFGAIQQMMGNVQSVATQVGDLKRLFGNIKTRGGWGEAQLKAMLDDFLPAGAYETNVRLRDDSGELVEFAIVMPSGDPRARLPLDAKFPSEDYERLMLAHEAGDVAAEALARRAIDARVRGEAAKIAEKYICPPRSTEYAILFLPTEGLYAEVARMPGLVDDVARRHRVFIAGPSLLPAMLKTIQLGYVSFALSQNAESVRELLSATKTEMAKMDGVLEKLGKQVGTVSSTIGTARTRTRAIARRLHGLEALPGGAAEALLEIVAADEEEEV